MQLDDLVVRIEELCSSHNVKVTRMLLDCGLKKNVVDNMRNGSYPSIDKVLTIAQYFNVNIEYLVGEKDQPRESGAREPMSPAQALYLVTKTKLGVCEAKVLFKIADIDIDCSDSEVNDEQLYWVSFHLFIPQEILREFIQNGASDNYSQLDEITETDYVKCLPFDTYLAYSPWWNGDADNCALSKEMYESRFSFSDRERKWIEYEYEYMKQRFSQLEAYEWVSDAEKQKPSEPNYQENNDYVSCSQEELNEIYSQMLLISNRVRSLGGDKKQISMSSAARDNNTVKAAFCTTDMSDRNSLEIKKRLKSAPPSPEDV